MGLKYSVRNDELVKEETKKAIKSFLELNEDENPIQQNLWDFTISPLREIYSSTCLH